MTIEKKTSYNTQELSELNLNFTQEEIINNLSNSETDDFIKIFSIISFEKFSSIDEVELFFHHLTNHPTPIREAIALKLEEIYCDEYLNEKIKEQFLKSIIDINPNVCRAICSIISKSSLLQKELIENLIKNVFTLLFEIEDNDKNLGGFFDDAQKIRKNHAKNKKLFSLYWFLEALSICDLKNYNSQALEIIKKTIKFNNYTIREKTAKILSNLEQQPIDLLETLQKDQNFYVKNLVYDKINHED